MRQEINLFREAEKPSMAPFSAAWMAWVLLLALLFFCLLSIAGIIENRRLRAKAVAAKWVSMQLEENLRQAKLQHPEIKPDANLLAETERLEHYIEDWNQFMLNIQGRDFQHRAGFAEYFEGLARRASADVWLTGINIKDGGQTLILQGCTLDKASRISEWLQTLGSEKAFQLKPFSYFKSTPKGNRQCPIEFTLSTRELETATK